MAYDTIHLREEMMMAADMFEQLSKWERIVDTLHNATLERAWLTWHELMEFIETDELNPNQYRDVMRLLDDVQRTIMELEASR